VSTVADPDTIGIGGSFDLLVIVRNGGEGRAEDIRSDGQLTISSPNGGEARVISGPLPAIIERLEPEERDTLVYRIEAKALGTLEFEVPVVGLDEQGEEVSATPECLIDGGNQLEKSLFSQNVIDVKNCQAEVTDIIVVNDTRDLRDYNTEDGRCDTVSEVEEEGDQCTLRGAIEEANARGEVAGINFDIPSADAGCYGSVCTITPETALPSVTGRVLIDGTTQPGYDPDQAPLITLEGRSTAIGLHLATDGLAVQGLTVTDFAEAGIKIEGSQVQVSRSRLLGNGVGVLVAGGTQNIIGAIESDGDGAQSSCIYNVIAGSAEAGIKVEQASSENTIWCNLIGVFSLVDGVDTAPNAAGILIENTPSQQISNNRIAGNTGAGVHIVGPDATGNLISENLIGGFEDQDTEGNQWGIVVESASNNTIGQPASSERTNANFISDNTLGNILIFSEEAEAPASFNVVHRNYVGTDLNGRATLENAGFGIAISGWASDNTIGARGGEGFSNVIGQHDISDIAIYGTVDSSATGNTVHSSLVGFGLEYLDGDSPAIQQFSSTNIDVRGAANTHLGASGTTPLIVGSAMLDAIQIDGRLGRYLVNLDGRKFNFDADLGPDVGGTRVQNVLVTTAAWREATKPVMLGRDGIDVQSTHAVLIGPDVRVETCLDPGSGSLNYGIFLDADESKIFGTDIAGCLTTGPTGNGSLGPQTNNIGISIRGSRNRIGTPKGAASPNTFNGLGHGLLIEGWRETDPPGNEPDARSRNNVVLGNLFGDAASNYIGIELGPGTEDTHIGGSAPEDENWFIQNQTGIRLGGREPGTFSAGFQGPLSGTIIEGNTFGTEDAPDIVPVADGNTAISIERAIGTRVGSPTIGGGVGGNRIRNYSIGVAVEKPVEEQPGTVILGNSIEVTRAPGRPGKGISVWDDLGEPLSVDAPFPVRPVTEVLEIEASSSGDKVSVMGFVWAQPERQMLVQLFRSSTCRGVNEGRDYLATVQVSTGILGLVQFHQEVNLSSNDGLTVTATDLIDRRTSEFSTCFAYGEDARTVRLPLDTEGTIGEEFGFLIRTPPTTAKLDQATDTLYVTAFPTAPASGPFSGQAALSAAKRTTLPTAAIHRYWRFGTSTLQDERRADVCFEATALSETEASEVVIIQRGASTGGLWAPYDSFLETHADTPYVCAYDLIPSGEFSFGQGDEALLAVPVLVSPQHDATDIDLSAKLTWQDVRDASNYDIQVSLDAIFSTLITDTSGVAGTSLSPDSLVSDQQHHWRVRGVTADGKAGPWSSAYRFVTGDVAVSLEGEAKLQETFALEANYPNPFNPTTTIGYVLPEAVVVRIAVYDLLGRRVQTLIDTKMPAGRHQVTFDASQLSTGIYIYQLNTGSERITRKMMLIK
jgi:hypothetical protein